MSVGATPSLTFIGETVGGVAPHDMSEMYRIRFASGHSPLSGTISLGDFRNKTLVETMVERAKIQASDLEDSDYFGISASISSDGNTAIVGAVLWDRTDGFQLGAAYIFTRSSDGSWTEQTKIQASDKEARDYFGRAVSISSDGNTVIVGAYLEDTDGFDAGAAYIFVRSSGGLWTEQAKVQASDKQQSDWFGLSVSISGDGNTALVGASLEDTGGTDAGAAYIFVRSGTTWTQQAKIQASDKQQSDWFGYSVSISSDGNTALVGAYQEDTGGTNAGAAYIFTRSGGLWDQQQKIQASDKQADDWFGWSVSISGDGNTALVASYGDDTGGGNAGAAHIFVRSSGGLWTEQAKVQASDKQASDRFGYSVSISSDGNTAIVGARLEDTGGTDAGAVYIFTRSGTTWTQKQKIQASDYQAGDNFGESVSISSDGNTALVGAAYEDTGATSAGAAYVFENSYYI